MLCHRLFCRAWLRAWPDTQDMVHTDDAAQSDELDNRDTNNPEELKRRLGRVALSWMREQQ